MNIRSLIDSKHDILFEFYRNKFFFESLLDMKIDLYKPTLFSINNNQSKGISKKYVIFFVGGSEKYKKWNPHNFSKVASHLNSKYDYDIVICGSSEDEKDASIIKKNYKGEILDLVGKTSLSELIELISNADLILSNESSGSHIAAALNKKNIFVNYNGRHLGRFLPYPKEITESYHVIYHPYIYNNIDHYKKISNRLNFKVFLDINEISMHEVIKKIDIELSK